MREFLLVWIGVAVVLFVTLFFITLIPTCGRDEVLVRGFGGYVCVVGHN